MSDCRFGVSPVNYPDPDPDNLGISGVQESHVFKLPWNRQVVYILFPI